MNVLFIFADQMHAFAMGCMGTPDIHTPNLNRLASQGVLFRNAYSNAPVCTPFRINLFSGLYGSQTDSLRNEARIPEGVPTLAQRLNEGGYRTSYVGKWHIGATGNQPVPPELRGGFTEFIGYQCYNDYLKDVTFFDEEGRRHERQGHRTDATTDVAIERMRRLAERRSSTGERFALFVSYQNPHYPEQPSPEAEAFYAGKRIARRANCQRIDPFTGTASPPSPRPFGLDANFQRYGNDLDEYLRLYYAMVTQLDANVGRLLEELDRLGLTDDTAVVFTSDHGDMQGSHGLKNKSLPWEESTRIPLIVRVPGGASGDVCEGPVSGVDFFPTTLEWAGLPPEPTNEGASFAPTTLGRRQRFDRPVFSEMKNWCMMRKGDFKIVADSDATEPTALFDLRSDPFEMNNLLGEESLPSTQKSLLDELAAWRRHTRETAVV